MAQLIDVTRMLRCRNLIIRRLRTARTPGPPSSSQNKSYTYNDPDIAIRIDKANRRFVVSAMPLGLIATVQMYGILVPRGEEDTMIAYAIKYPLPEIALALAMVVFTLCFGASMAVVALVAFKSVNIGLLVGDIGLSAFLLLGQYVLLWRAPADSGRRDEQIFV